MRNALLLLAFTSALVSCSPPPKPPAPSAEPPPPSPQPAESADHISEAEGVWAVSDENGQPYDFVLFPNGQAISTRGKSSSSARGLRGFWRTDGTKISVFLANGWTHILQPGGGEIRHSAFAPGHLDNPPIHSSAARRVEGPLSAFVGIWRLNKEPDGSYLYLTLESSGAAFSSVAGIPQGKWETVSDAARCTWPDGWVDQISLTDSGWQKKSWVGGDESTPADLSEAVRVGLEPFEISP